jgi:hypothetical protein
MGEGQSAKSASVDPQSTWESAKVRSEFQREIYKVRDGRIAADDVQASILAGSAAAVATIGSAAIRDANDSALWLIAIVSLAGLTAFVALFARREIPSRRGLTEPLDLARDEVQKVHSLKESDVSAVMVYEQCFNAWWAMTKSAERRENQKRTIYSAAVLLLMAELVVAAIAISVL